MGNLKLTVLDRPNSPVRKKLLPVLTPPTDHAEPALVSRHDTLCPHLAAACIYANGGDTVANAAATRNRTRDYIDVDAGEIL